MCFSHLTCVHGVSRASLIALGFESGLAASRRFRGKGSMLRLGCILVSDPVYGRGKDSPQCPKLSPPRLWMHIYIVYQETLN